MPKLTAKILKMKIAALQKKLAAVERAKAPAIRKVRAQMRKLGVTLSDLIKNSPPKSSISKPLRNAPPSAPRRRREIPVRVQDEHGNKWSGRGKTPRWLVTAEKVGRSREEFKVK